MATLLKGNNYIPEQNFFVTSINEENSDPIVISETNNRNLVLSVLEKLNASVDDHYLSDENKFFLSHHLNLNLNDVREIEEKTLLQSNSSCWFEERRKCLTASNFGAVLNRRKDIYPKSILKKILGSNNSNLSAACQLGKSNEPIAVAEYETLTHLRVQLCGLIINPKWPWLGCSPDGVVSEESRIKAIEIKCPFSQKCKTVEEACHDKSFFMHIVNGKPKLKERHVYFFQCQGVMAITELEEIDFIHNNMICLSCHGPNDLTLGYVSRDSSLIIGQLERIKLFYLYKCNRIENAIINTFSPIVVETRFTVRT